MNKVNKLYNPYCDGFHDHNYYQTSLILNRKSLFSYGQLKEKSYNLISYILLKYILLTLKTE